MLNAALRKLGGIDALRKQSDPVAWLTERVRAELPEGREVLRITVPGLEARDGPRSPTPWPRAYATEVAQKDIADRQRRLRNLKDALATVQMRLSTHRDDRTKRAMEVGLPPGESDRKAAVAALYQERAGLRTELAREDRKRVRDALEAVGEKIKLAEAAGLDGTAAEVTHLESAAALSPWKSSGRNST